MAAWESEADRQARYAREDARRRAAQRAADDSITWGDAADWSLDVLNSFLAPGPQPGGKLVINDQRQSTGFSLEEQWPWIALGGLGVILLVKRN